MDKYIVSARKYRPATFRSVVGQKALTSTLKNAIASDRLAQAYLFCGPRGVGKTSCARIFAKTINCLHPTADGEACCECENCKAIERGTSLNVVELDAASNNSVDDIRDITDQVQTPPQGGKYRVFIIDEVHMLSSAAFNAFLKTLEEPPKYVIFILATTEKHKVLPTILSRCQTYDFRRITIEDMVEQMQYIGQQEGIKTDPRGLEVIARKADGAMRDALSIFDQVAASSRGDITYESAIENLNVLDYDYYFRLVESFRTGDISGALLLYRDVRAKGFDSLFFLNGLADHVRNLMVAADPRTAELLETSKDVAERYTQQAKSLPLQWYYAAMKVLNDGDVQYRTATNKQFLVELVLIRLSQLLKPATPPFDLVDCDYPLGDITVMGGGHSDRRTTPTQSTIARTTINDERLTINDQRLTINDERSTVNDQRLTINDQRSTISDQRLTINDERSTVNDQRTTNNEQRLTVNDERLTINDERSTINDERLGINGKRSPEIGRRRRTATGFRLNDDSVQQKIAEYEEQRKEHRAAVDIGLFTQAWAAYQQANPQQHILTSAMRNSSPQQTGPEEFLAMVGHPAEVQAFELAMPQLMAFLRRQLGNDFLTLRVEIDPTRAVSKQLPPQEFLKECVEKNPGLADLLRKLDAELA